MNYHCLYVLGGEVVTLISHMGTTEAQRTEETCPWLQQHEAELGAKAKAAPFGILFVPNWAS